MLANANWESDRFKALCYAAIGVLFRPTNAVLWVFLGCKHWLAVRSRFKFITFNVLPIGVLTTSIMIIIDYLYYKKWTFVPYNFVLFNLLQVWQKKLIWYIHWPLHFGWEIQGKDHLYGTHAWSWYFIQGFPTISTTFIPFIFYGYLCAPVCAKSHRSFHITSFGRQVRKKLVIWFCGRWSFTADRHIKVSNLGPIACNDWLALRVSIHPTDFARFFGICWLLLTTALPKMPKCR